MRIMLADDHKMMREGLIHLFANRNEITIVAEATTGLEAVSLALQKKPDLVLMDISMSDINGLEATRRILRTLPSTRVIILSMHKERRYIEESLKAGAYGYVLKECAFEEVLQAIEAARQNRFYLSHQITEIVVNGFMAYSNSNNSAFRLLTPREREVLQLIAEGKSTVQIAEIFFLSEKTIETHRRNIMMKLKLDSVAELTRYAIREGIIEA